MKKLIIKTRGQKEGIIADTSVFEPINGYSEYRKGQTQDGSFEKEVIRKPFVFEVNKNNLHFSKGEISVKELDENKNNLEITAYWTEGKDPQKIKRMPVKLVLHAWAEIYPHLLEFHQTGECNE